jgi:hypothetical protein
MFRFACWLLDCFRLLLTGSLWLLLLLLAGLRCVAAWHLVAVLHSHLLPVRCH